MIKFNQNNWLKPYIDINTDLRKKQKIILKEIFFKLIYNAVFGKAMENVKKDRDIKLVITKKEETTWCQNQIFILQRFSQIIY